MSSLSTAILMIGLRGLGVSNFDPALSDEKKFLHRIKDRLPRSPVIFDVGANQGQYAKLVRDIVAASQIVSFEPNPVAFARLEKAPIAGRFTAVRAAVGAERRKVVLYDYHDRLGSEHASLVDGVIDKIHGGHPLEVAVDMITIDSYVAENAVDRIDILKIDVEGAEIGVLQGATATIANKAVGILQIEFNEMHAISRTFVRDISDLLPDHRLYRLLRNGELLDLTNRPTIVRELFGYQNLIALPENISETAWCSVRLLRPDRGRGFLLNRLRRFGYRPVEVEPVRHTEACMNLGRYLMAPIWVAALATGAKSFRDNPVIGSSALNRRGLHARRAKLAHAMAWRRRARLASMISAQDRAAFDRDGFVLRENFLPPAEFARLRERIFAYRAPAREMLQGDTITRRFAVDPEFIAAVLEIKSLLANPDWRGLNRYVGSFDQEPLTYIQTILSHVRDAKPDPQTDLHIDTFHPTVKAFYFLTDVKADEGPFVYVPGSHRLTEKRLAWEYGQSIGAATSGDRLASRGSLRATPAEIEAMGFAPARAFSVPANTLVVADTVGFHARGPSLRPSVRVEIWTYGRRNPFLPWTGLDLWSLPGLAERRIPFLWDARDFLQKRGLIAQPWKDVGRLRPQDPPGLPVA